MISVRYIANDVGKAVTFYRDLLGFTVEMNPAPGFALLSLDNLKLFINQPGAGGAGQTLQDGTVPEPGGWNRLRIEVGDIEAKIEELTNKGAAFRGDLIEGNGGKQVLIEDPSGNPIELFEPKK